MSDIQIKTDGTIENTILTVDGEDITAGKNIVSINLSADAAWTSKYSGDKYPGSVHVRYRYEEDGTFKSISVGTSSDSDFSGKIGEMKNDDSISRFVGADVDSNIKNLVDKIIDHCENEKINIVDKNILYSRSFDSLTDKAHDLGIDIT